MRKLILILLVCPLFGFSQINKEKILTDTSIAVGIVTEDCFVSLTIDNFCINGVDKYLNKRTSVIISGIQNCKANYIDKTTKFYEIIYKTKTYFIEKDKLLTYDNYYTDIEKMSPETADSFRIHAQTIANSANIQTLKEALNFLDKCKSKGLSILSWEYYDESEYTQGTSVNIRVHNPTSKVVKYIWFTFVGYNPVGDIVVDRTKRASNITVKAVGPIKPDETGTYNYTYVWFTDLVETAKIANIKVQYMDGSIKSILNPKEIILPASYASVLLGEEDDDN